MIRQWRRRRRDLLAGSLMIFGNAGLLKILEPFWFFIVHKRFPRGA